MFQGVRFGSGVAGFGFVVVGCVCSDWDASLGSGLSVVQDGQVVQVVRVSRVQMCSCLPTFRLQVSLLSGFRILTGTKKIPPSKKDSNSCPSLSRYFAVEIQVRSLSWNAL